MDRERRPSFWRAMGRDIANDIKASQTTARKRVKTLSDIFASPWTGKDSSMSGRPKRRTLENLHVFLRNNEIIPKAIRPLSEEEDERFDKAIIVLVACTLIIGFMVVVFLFLH